MDPYHACHWLKHTQSPWTYYEGQSPFYNDLFRQIIKGCVHRTL